MKRSIWLLLSLLLLISCGEDDITSNNSTTSRIVEKIIKENRLVKSGDTYFFQGDIAFSMEDLKRMANNMQTMSQARGNFAEPRLYNLMYGQPYRIWRETHKLDLSYSFITPMSLSNLSDALVKQAFREAADAWMGAANIRLYEKPSGGRISIARVDDYTKNDNAWAWYPYASSQHIVLNRPIVNGFKYSKIRSILMHELGHALGLAHEHQRAESTYTYGQGFYGIPYGSYDTNSIMDYASQYKNRLSPGDTNTIRHAYQRIGTITQTLPGDFNGDGRTDLAIIADGNAVQTLLSQPTGKYKLVKYYPSQDYRTVGTGKWLTGDFNADGKTDLVHIVTVASRDYMHPWYSNGDGTYVVHRYSPHAGYRMDSGEWRAGDFDGDGDTDLVHLVNANYVHVHSSLRNGQFRQEQTFFPSGVGGTYQIIGAGKWLTGDFNADGKTDLVHIVTIASKDYMHPWYSNGNGTFIVHRYSPHAGYRMDSGEWRAGDFDGDGDTDLVHLVDAHYVHLHASLRNGQFQQKQAYSPSPDYRIIGTGKWLTGDFNADGKTDLIHIVTDFGGNYVHPWLSNGNGTFEVKRYSPSNDYNNNLGFWSVGKADTDNKDDILHIPNQTYIHPWHSTGNGNFALEKKFF